MEIPSGKYCDQGQEPNCPFSFCPFSDFRATCVPDVYRGVDFVTMRSKECLTAYPNGAVIEIKAKEKVK
jgi:hypothetical protein